MILPTATSSEKKPGMGEEFVRKFWKPWFEAGEWVSSEWDEKASSPTWLSVLSAVPLQWITSILLCLALLGSSYFKWTSTTQLSSSPSAISYIDATKLMELAERSGDWSDVQKRVLKRYVNWEGFIVSAKSPTYVIQPRRERPQNEREKAIVSLADPREHPAYQAGERVTVSGNVSRFDSEGIDIVGGRVTGYQSP